MRKFKSGEEFEKMMKFQEGDEYYIVISNKGKKDFITGGNYTGEFLYNILATIAGEHPEILAEFVSALLAGMSEKDLNKKEREKLI